MPLLTIVVAVIAALVIVVMAFRGPRLRPADGVELSQEARVRRGLHVLAIVVPLTTLVVLQAVYLRLF